MKTNKRVKKKITSVGRKGQLKSYLFFHSAFSAFVIAPFQALQS
jgi:hypothetical protein